MMSVANREYPDWARPVLIWLMVTVLAVLAGPFGTFEAMGPISRAVYWASVVAASLALGRVVGYLRHGRAHWVRLGLLVLYALILAVGLHVLNRQVFPSWQGWTDFGFLVGVVLVVVLVIEAAVALGGGPSPSASETGFQVAGRFLRRLPVDKRGPLVRLEAQDHYLQVVTLKGRATVLMRMVDAEDELDLADGLRVHRSHWVALDQVQRHCRRDGRDFLLLSDGVEIPVSRSYRDAVKAAGLI